MTLNTPLMIAAGLLGIAMPAGMAVAQHAAHEAQPAASSADLITSAMSAAPEAVARNATIVAANPDGTMKTLRKGSNGFTCMPDSPATPGPDPMCMDANALKWAQAWIGKKTPPANSVGLIYMLRGGTDASNIDPHAAKPTATNAWV